MPLTFYWQNEAILKVCCFFLTGGCLPETLVSELYSIDWNCLGRTIMNKINSVRPNLDLNSKRRLTFVAITVDKKSCSVSFNFNTTQRRTES